MAIPVKEHRLDPAPVPMRAVRLGPRDVVVDRRPDGIIHLRSPHPLPPYPAKLTERLEHWAAIAPERLFLAQRNAVGGWRYVSYASALEQVRRIGTFLLGCGLSPARPIVILSGNDIEHALLALAAIYVGIPYAPISPAYSLISADFSKLRYICDLLTPGLVFAADGERFARAIDALDLRPNVMVVLARNARPNHATFELLLTEKSTAPADNANAAVGPDTIAKFLFTSGSTGTPKAVINTQRMWCANQAMILSQLAYFADEPPVIVDWSPWHHTAGGNHNFGFVLYNGGTFYIDEGKPAPGAIETTVKNLREVATNWYFTVPKGYEALLPYLRADAALRQTFFSRLKVLWFAGAALSQSVFDEMQELALATCGERIMFLTGLGSTESAPMAIARMWQSKDSANMGVPVPGCAVKLVPTAGKLEARLKGPNVMPGYWRHPELTAAAFDEEGYYRLGDALRFEDPADPREGLLFNGRIAEDFKLATGTWVHVGPLRASLLAALEPYARDVVIAGANCDEIGALIFPNLETCRALADDADDPTDDAHVCEVFRERLDAFAKTSTGSSNRVCRAILLAEPPSLDAGEMTDKGSINQRAVLERRATAVAELYAPAPSSRVLAIDSDLRS